MVPAGGGKSEFAIPTCGRDALTFQYFARREMGQGRVPPAGKVFFGSGYEVKTVYTGRAGRSGGGQADGHRSPERQREGPGERFHF